MGRAEMKAPPRASQAGDRRTAPRRTTERDSTARLDAATLSVTVFDCSAGGCKFHSDVPLEAGTRIVMGLAGAGACAAEITWRDGQTHGCQFLTPLNAEVERMAFAGTPVIQIQTGAWPADLTDVAEFPAPPADAKWPRPVRVAFLLAAGAAAWGLVALLLA